ncbi:unnamed protein product [Ilex paraguariensis]|uniref:RNase H type-1 domain-containing protein n=1 Tax=Ilex paraguariensis TaxID=185542 RepID=A0ABC8RKA7_9AQUA
MEAEMRALLDGLCRLLDYSLDVYPILIESDSQILVDMVNHTFEPPWRCKTLLNKILAILGRLDFRIQHTYKEGNSVPNSFVNKGILDRVTTTYSSSNTIPTHIRLLIQQEQRQIRSIRKMISIKRI